MKLFSKYNRINIVATIGIFLFGCFAFYLILRYVLIRELDDTLRTEQAEMVNYARAHGQLPEIINANDQLITIDSSGRVMEEALIKSVKTWDSKQAEYIWRRELQFSLHTNNKHYFITVSKSQVETEDLLRLVILVAAFMIALILLLSYFLNRLLIRNLWQPFFQTMKKMETYHPGQNNGLQFGDTGIYEFDLLNRQLASMIERTDQAFKMVKDFSIQAAHEMQTPLAVIRSKTEELMQDESLLLKHAGKIERIESSVSGLSRMSQTLLLLTKIENSQFDKATEIDMKWLITEKLKEYAERIEADGIILKTQLDDCAVYGHPFLLDIIVGNLLKNAIRYNSRGGELSVRLSAHQLSIANHSYLPALPPNEIGKRFFRHAQTRTEGNGLGLSLVKETGIRLGFTLAYDFEDSQHVFTLNFKQKQSEL